MMGLSELSVSLSKAARDHISCFFEFPPSGIAPPHSSLGVFCYQLVPVAGPRRMRKSRGSGDWNMNSDKERLSP